MTKAEKTRTCFACSKKDEKTNLIRWVVFKEKVVSDLTQKMEGRALYTHYSKECVLNFFNTKKFPEKFLCSPPVFEVDKSEILDFIKSKIISSINYFVSICRKSGMVAKGQSLIVEKTKKGQKFKYLVNATDVSEKTVAEVEKATGMKSFAAELDKSEIGAMFDGRPVGVFALIESAQSEKLFFYIGLLRKFISGDKNDS
ncbi:MAG: DUF448 domain-containing protein [bacterium]